MTDSQQLREAIWDLVYGLLSSDESQALIARIKSDPQAARMYSEVRLQADLVGQAARVEDAPLVFKAEAAGKSAAAKPIMPAAVQNTASQRGAWLAGIAATALVALLAVGYGWPRTDQRHLARNFVATDILAQRSMPAGLTNEITLRTYFVSTDGSPMDGTPATVQLRLVDRAGKEQLHQTVQTNKMGHANVAIPGNALEPGVRVEIGEAERSVSRAEQGPKQQSAPSPADEAKETQQTLLAADLPVQPEPQMAYFLCAEPTVEAGKPVQFSQWNFNAFTAKPAPPGPSQKSIESIGGVVEPPIAASVQEGLVNGVLQAKDNVQRDGAQELSYRQIENRLALSAGNSQDARGTRRNVEFGARRAAPGQAPAVVRLEQAQRLPETLREKAESRAAGIQAAQAGGAKPARSLGRPEAQGGEQLAREAESVATFAAGQPIQIAIPAEFAGKPVLAAAICRGVTVATAANNTAANNTTANNTEALSDKAVDRAANENAIGGKKSATANGQLSLPLPPEADGWIEVALFDRAGGGAEPVHREYVYREPLRKLQIELPQLKPRFAPGEAVELSLRVTDENGRPAADTRLGVRVWNEQLVQQSAEQPVLLADAVHAGAGEIEEGYAVQSMPAIDQKLALDHDELAAANRPAGPDSVALKQLKETIEESPSESKVSQSGLKRQDEADREAAAAIAAPEAIELATNRDTIQEALREATDQAESHRQRMMQTMGAAAIVGAIAVLLLLGVLALLRMPSGMATTVPVLATAAASLLIGLAWTGWLPRPRMGQIALAPAAPTAAAGPQESAANTDAPQSSSPASNAAARGRNEPAGAPAEGTSLAAVPLAVPAAPAIAGSAGGGSAASAAASGPAALRAELSRSLPPADRALRKEQNAKGEKQLADRVAPPAKSTEAKPEAAKADSSAAPAALYFNPQLVTDAEGRATVRFVMPQVDSEYRVLIDALGQGRIGSTQQLISSGPPAAAGAK